MRPKALKDLLRKTVPERLPVMIKGAPGIGKTDIVRQVAEELGTDLVISHPVVSDPTDYKGLPAVVEGEAEFLPFGDLRRIIDADKPTIAFLDDLGQAPATVQAAAMQLILGRRVNGHRVSDHVTFIAATNRRQDKAGVKGILEPVKSRFASIVELEPHLDDWCGWAFRNNVSPQVIAFVRFRPELLADTSKPTGEIVNRPSPRTVAYLSSLIQVGIEDAEALAGSVGEGFATEFVGFLRVWKSLPDIDEILNDPFSAEVPTNPATVFAVVAALNSRVDKKNSSQAIRYFTRLPEEYAVLGIRDCLRKNPEAAECSEYIQWASRNKEVLV